MWVHAPSIPAHSAPSLDVYPPSPLVSSTAPLWSIGSWRTSRRPRSCCSPTPLQAETAGPRPCTGWPASYPTAAWWRSSSWPTKIASWSPDSTHQPSGGGIMLRSPSPLPTCPRLEFQQAFLIRVSGQRAQAVAY